MKVKGQPKCCKCDEQAIGHSFDGTGWCEEHLRDWKSFLRRRRGEFQGLGDAFDAWFGKVSPSIVYTVDKWHLSSMQIGR